MQFDRLLPASFEKCRIFPSNAEKAIKEFSSVQMLGRGGMLDLGEDLVQEDMVHVDVDVEAKSRHTAADEDSD